MALNIIRNSHIESDYIEKIIIPVKNKIKISMDKVKKDGIFPVISQDRNFISGYTDNVDYIEVPVNNPVILFGDHTTETKLINFNFCAGGDGTQIFRTNEKMVLDYLYFLLKNGLIKQDGYKRHFKDLKESLINYPIIKDQKKIVKVLHNESNKISKIKSLLEKIEIRNQYYADKLLSGEYTIEDQKIAINNSLKDFNLNQRNIAISTDMVIEKVENVINELPKSKLAASHGKKEGNYRFFKSSSEIYYSDEFLYDNEALILADGGAPNVEYYNGKFSASNHTYIINSEIIDTKYLYYFFRTNMNILEDCFQGAALKNLSKKQFKDCDIFFYKNKAQQLEIVKCLDKLYYEKEKIQKLLELEEKRFEWLSDKLLSGEYIIED